MWSSGAQGTEAGRRTGEEEGGRKNCCEVAPRTRATGARAAAAQAAGPFSPLAHLRSTLQQV